MKCSPEPWRWAWVMVSGDGNSTPIAIDNTPVFATGSRQEMEETRAYNRKLIAASPRMREMLLKLEWSSVDQSTACCPSCVEWEENGHRPGCPLAALLGELR